MRKKYFRGPLMASQGGWAQHISMAKAPPTNRIEEIRKAKGMTLEELAERSGFSTPFVWQMAHGVRSIKLANLERLAAALDCRPEDLISTETATNTEILNVWAAIPVDRRELALTVLQNFTNVRVDTPADYEFTARGKRKRSGGSNSK